MHSFSLLSPCWMPQPACEEVFLRISCGNDTLNDASCLSHIPLEQLHTCGAYSMELLKKSGSGVLRVTMIEEKGTAGDVVVRFAMNVGSTFGHAKRSLSAMAVSLSVRKCISPPLIVAAMQTDSLLFLRYILHLQGRGSACCSSSEVVVYERS